MRNYGLILILFFVITIITAQETAQNKEPFMFLLPLGYDIMRFENQTIHNPALGAGFLSGEQGLPFDEIDRSFFGLALYRPIIFKEAPYPDLPLYIHQIEALFDCRIKRHQLLFILNSASDKPISGGLNTFSAGAGWGYEVIRKRQLSLILGGALAVSDFGISLPNGSSLPVLPVPLVRFGIDTEWFTSSFEFLTGPNLEFTIAPKQKIRFTADMRMDNYRSIDDVICEFILWYRLFSTEHKLGDFAGIGLGLKNDSVDFSLSSDVAAKSGIKTFELQQTSVFACLDLSILNIQAGWIFDSRYFVDEKKTGSYGKGFYISVQGIIPFERK